MLKFNREEYRGTELDWFAVDRNGAIALFSTGYGLIPKKVFESESVHRRLCEFFEAKAESSEVRHAPSSRPTQTSDIENDLFLQEARRGLYSYWQCDYNAFAPYELMAYPLTPASFDELPAEIQALLQPFHFESIDFTGASTIRVQEHFECE